jgi:seryl-tRNA synthetase
MLGHVGNLVHESVPIGKPQEPNPVLRQWGQKEQKHSLEQDLERGEKVAGPGNYFLLGQSVLLKLKLINEATAFFSACGYSLIQPPLFVRGVAT